MIEVTEALAAAEPLDPAETGVSAGASGEVEATGELHIVEAVPAPERSVPSPADLARVADNKAYIEKYQAHCDRHLGRIADPAGKRVLVVGSGWGTEILWALRHGAREVVGVDPSPRTMEPLEAALAEIGRQDRGRYAMHQCTTLDLPASGDFDLIVSNNVAEHIHGLKATFESLRGLIAPGGRIALFCDPLYYSSMGAHLPIAPWEHLTGDVRGKVSDYGWNEYIHGLNRMTVVDFLMAVREAGLVLLDFQLLPDRNMRKICEAIKQVRHYPLDLTVEGISTIMCFPENV